MFLLTDEEIAKEAIKSFAGECVARAQLKKVVEVRVEECKVCEYPCTTVGEIAKCWSDFLVKLRKEAGHDVG